MHYAAQGHIVGNGAAINMAIGWYPDWVRVTNLTDGDLVTEAHLGTLAIPFSSGGTSEVTAGKLITGATSGSQAWIVATLISSGTWAAGSAAGFFIVEDQTGTFASEAVYIPGGTDDATITAAVTPNIATAAAVASATGNAAISRYTGSIGSAAKGFTIGSTIAEEAKLLHWMAWRAVERVYGQ